MSKLKPQTWKVLSNNQQLISTLTEISNERLSLAFEVLCGTLEDGIGQLDSESSSNYLIIDISDTQQPFDMLSLIADHCPQDTYLLVVGKQNDIGFYKKLMAFGADDYLTLPTDKETIANSLITIKNQHTDGNRNSRGTNKLVSFIGASSGVGTSTLCSNLAYILAEEHKIDTCLVDLDLYFGSSTLAFNLEPNHGLSNLLCNPERIDASFIEHNYLTAFNHLSILSADLTLNDEVELEDSTISNMIAEVRSINQITLVDIPRSELSSSIGTLYSSNQIYIVAELTINTIRNAGHMIKWLKNHLDIKKVNLIVLETKAAEGQNIPLSEIEKTLNIKTSAIIPFDRTLAISSCNIGTPITKNEPGSHLSKKYLELAEKLHPQVSSKGNSIIKALWTRTHA